MKNSGCITPLVKVDGYLNKTVAIPCGKCPKCVARRTSAWSFRLMQEDKVSDSSLFITLTYDTDHVPFSKNGFMDLRKRDLQLFFKRLRKSSQSQLKKDRMELQGKLQGTLISKPIKYYAVGEYGGKTKRPHYHIILFNAKLELIHDAWCVDGKEIGQIHYGQVEGASVGYTMKYIAKPWKPMHRNDDRTPQFALMSKDLVRHMSQKAQKLGTPIRRLLKKDAMCHY